MQVRLVSAEEQSRVDVARIVKQLHRSRVPVEWFQILRALPDLHPQSTRAVELRRRLLEDSAIEYVAKTDSFVASRGSSAFTTDTLLEHIRAAPAGQPLSEWITPSFDENALVAKLQPLADANLVAVVKSNKAVVVALDAPARCPVASEGLRQLFSALPIIVSDTGAEFEARRAGWTQPVNPLVIARASTKRFIDSPPPPASRRMLARVLPINAQ